MSRNSEKQTATAPAPKQSIIEEPSTYTQSLILSGHSSSFRPFNRILQRPCSKSTAALAFAQEISSKNGQNSENLDFSIAVTFETVQHSRVCTAALKNSTRSISF